MAYAIEFTLFVIREIPQLINQLDYKQKNGSIDIYGVHTIEPFVEFNPFD